MTFTNNYAPLSSKYSNSYPPHRSHPPPASFTRKRPYTPPRSLSPAYTHFSPSRHPHTARPRRRELDSPHSSSHSSYAAPPRRPQKRRRSAPVASALPRDLHDGNSAAKSPAILSASFSQATLGCISTADNRKQGIAQVWDVSSNPHCLKLRNTLHHPNRVFRAALSSDASIAVTTCQDGNFRLWSAAGLNYTPKKLSFHRAFRNARACALSPDAKYAAVSFYRGCRRPVDDGGDHISSFQSQLFVVDLQSYASLFETVEHGIADQIIISENASTVAVGLCGVSPARTIAKRHKIVVYNNLGNPVTTIRDCFPPDRHSCTAWHMPATGDVLALCSRHNDLQVYHSGPRKDWAQAPIVLQSRTLHGFSQCRFARDPDILAAVGSSGKSKESSLGLFRVSDATLLFIIPIPISIGHIFDIYPYVSVSNAMETENVSHSVAVISDISGKSWSGPRLDLHFFSDTREPARTERLPPPEAENPPAEQQPREQRPMDNSWKSQPTNSGGTPFRLCRDPSPLRPLRHESPSASRSSAAMKSSESSVQTPLHNRFASWLMDNNMKQTKTSSETESQNSRRGDKASRTGEKKSLPSAPKEGALKRSDPRQIEKDATHAEFNATLNEDTTRHFENDKTAHPSDVDVQIPAQKPSTKSRSEVNTRESMSSTEAGSLPDMKNSEPQLEPHIQSKRPISSSPTEGLVSSASSRQNALKAVQPKPLVINGRDKNTSSLSETKENKNSNNQRESKPAIHVDKAPSTRNIKAFEPSRTTKDKNGIVKRDKRKGSSNSQNKKDVPTKQCSQSELTEANSKKDSPRASPEKVSQVPTQESSAKLNGVGESKGLKSESSNGRKDPKIGSRDDKCTVVAKESAKQYCLSAEGSKKMNVDRIPLDEECEKEKIESASVISTPQSDDWTPATRFAAREHSRLKKIGNTDMKSGIEHPTPLILKKDNLGSNQSLADAHHKQVSVGSKNEKHAAQNIVRTGSLFKSMRNGDPMALDSGKSDQNLSDATKNVKREVQSSLIQRPTGIPKREMEEKNTAMENPKKEVCNADIIENKACETLEGAASIPKSSCDVSVSNGIPQKIASVADKQFHVVSLGSGEKETLWPTKGTVQVEKKPEKSVMPVQEDERSDHNQITIPARLLEQCRKAFAEACRAFRVPDMNTLTNQEAYTTMLCFTEKEIGYAEKKTVAKIIYDIVGIQNACSLEMFMRAFRLILTRVRASRREQWTEVFSRATCKEGESILVFHARDLLKAEHVRNTIHMAEKWTDNALEALFERISDGMLVDLASFLQCIDEVLDS